MPSEIILISGGQTLPLCWGIEGFEAWHLGRFGFAFSQTIEVQGLLTGGGGGHLGLNGYPLPNGHV